jgi:hypothetical protein
MSTYEIASVLESGSEITVVRLTGQAESANVHALLTELQALARQRGALRLLIDETDLKPGLMGFNDMHELVNDWRRGQALRASRVAVVAVNPFVRGLNQMFRLLANLERTGSMNAFSQRTDAVAWLIGPSAS